MNADKLLTLKLLNYYKAPVHNGKLWRSMMDHSVNKQDTFQIPFEVDATLVNNAPNDGPLQAIMRQ